MLFAEHQRRQKKTAGLHQRFLFCIFYLQSIVANDGQPCNFLLFIQHSQDNGEAKGLSQKEVALASKIDNSNYSKIEGGKTDPSFSSILKIAKALGVDSADLFRADELFKEVNSKDKTLMEKLSLINTLAKDEQQAIFRMIDLAASNKRLKDNLTQLIAQ